MEHVRPVPPVLLLAALLAASSAPLAPQAGTPPPAGADTVRPGAAAGTVSGRVLSSRGRLPVEGAAVLARGPDGGTLAVTATDGRGRYRLTGLPAGRLALDVYSTDHRSRHLELELPTASALRVDVVVRLDPPSLPPLVAVGERTVLAPAGGDPGDGEGAAGRRADPELRSLEAGPGGAWLGGALAARGDPPPSEPEGALYVRGGASDLKRVYLDGAPVYSPFHLGGLMDAVPEGVLRSARLYTGGAPLAYDGGLSYVLDLRTRRGGDGGPRLAGHADLMGASLRARGGGRRAAYLVSGRRVHPGAADWLAGGDVPYGYRELLARVDLSPGGGHRLALTGFANREAVRLGGAGGAGPAGEGTSWGNEAASLRWATRVGRTRLLTTAAASRFSTRLPVTRDPARRARSETRHGRLALDATTDLDGLELAWGAGFDAQRLEIELPPTDGDPGLRLRGRGGSLAAYGEATFRPAPELSVRAGLRGFLFGDSAEARLAPRVAATWRASPTTELEASAGRFHKRLVAPESVLSSDLDAWTEALAPVETDGEPVPGDLPALGVASASHVSVRVAHRPRDELSLGLEGHFKTFDELADGHDLHASGADLWVEWDSEGWRAGGGYSLAWAWSDAPPDSAARSFTGRQLLSARVEAPLPSGLRLSARLRASTGLPFTRVPLTPAESQEGPVASDPGPGETDDTGLALAGPPDGDYLRLDLALSRSWDAEVLGRETTLRPYLRLLNALDQRDALFYHFDPSGQVRPRALDTMPVLPVVGLAWEVR